MPEQVNLFRTMLTEDDENFVWSPARMAWLVANAVFLALSVYDTVWMGRPFDPQAFGVGLAAVNGAGGASVYMSEGYPESSSGRQLPHHGGE